MQRVDAVAGERRRRWRGLPPARLYAPGRHLRRPGPRRAGIRRRAQRTGCQEMTGPIVVPSPSVRSTPSARSLLATVGDVDRDQLLAFVGGDEGGDAAAVGGEDRVGLRAVGQLGELASPCRGRSASPRGPVAAEEQRVAAAGDVFDVGRADAATCGFTLVPLRRHRVDVGVGGRRLRTAVAAAEDDAAGEVARVELVDAGRSVVSRVEAGAARADRVEVVVGRPPATEVRTKTIVLPSGEKRASCVVGGAAGQRRAGRRRASGPCRGRPARPRRRGARRRRCARSARSAAASRAPGRW